MTNISNMRIDLSKINFPDLNFKKYLLEVLGKDINDSISKTDALSITKIECPSMDIVSLDGIEYFKNLTEINCHSNKIVNFKLAPPHRYACLSGARA